MTGTCRFSFGQRAGAATWSYDGLSVVVTPEGAGPSTYPVKELAGISGDDYTVSVVVPEAGGVTAPGSAARLVLSHLGHDGPTLAESLRRDWLKARTEVLRLGGAGEGWLVHGQVAGLDGAAWSSSEATASDSPSEPFRALLYQDVLVVAREGRDLEPVFLALLESVTFDETTYNVQAREWPGRTLVFSRLAKQTDEFVKRLGESRSLLANEAAATLAAAVPTLAAEGRGALAGAWMPGRLLELAQMETACAGFEAGFSNAWLARLLRREEGAYLAGWASPTGTWLGCTRETGSATGAAEGEAAAAGVAQRPLWMLAGRQDKWFLEALSMDDHATYRFKGGDEVPALVSRLLCAPQFSKEALYSPLADLTGDRADLAIPAGALGFLVALRERFQGRLIHKGLEAWRAEVG